MVVPTNDFRQNQNPTIGVGARAQNLNQVHCWKMDTIFNDRRIGNEWEIFRFDKHFEGLRTRVFIYLYKAGKGDWLTYRYLTLITSGLE